MQWSVNKPQTESCDMASPVILTLSPLCY